MNTIKILIADDAYFVRKTVRYRLALERGLEMFVASSRCQTLQLVRTVRPQLLLLAASFARHADGCLVDAIRSDEQSTGNGWRTRIVLLEDRNRPASLGDAVSAEASAEEVDVEEILFKPFDLEFLVQRIRALTGKAEMGRGDAQNSLGSTSGEWCTI